MRILIAEDDFTSRMMLDGVLTKWGFTTVVTTNGQEAWEVMRRADAPAIAILDWQMPIMNGLEICRKLGGIEQSTPPYLILLTARGDKKDIVKGLDAGANDYILKPYDNEELLARIRVGQRMVQLQREMVKLNQTLLHEAMHDQLTGIYNRRAIINTLEKELDRAARGENPLSIGLCDIDHFKSINDTYGHQVGDDVLRGFVKLVEKQLRKYDYVGRYGGEEFLIVSPDSKGTKSEGLYERICRYISERKIQTGHQEIVITVSIGVAAFSGGQTVQTLLSASDAALYRSKEGGRNRVSYAP
jgi:two-component system cell cycle response regulator